MTSSSRATSMRYINETHKIKDIFKSFDGFIEEIEEEVVEEEEVGD